MPRARRGGGLERARLDRREVDHAIGPLVLCVLSLLPVAAAALFMYPMLDLRWPRQTFFRNGPQITSVKAKRARASSRHGSQVAS